MPSLRNQTMPMHPKEIEIKDFTYSLPDERIAAFPLPERDRSKLLIYKMGEIQEDSYANIAQYLPEGSLLVFNNTRVIPARVLFQKNTGAIIEIFCLEPYEPVNEFASIMNKKENSRWKCLIGGASKWKEGSLVKKITIQDEEVELRVGLIKKLPDAYVAEFSWQPANFSFAEIIERAGETPLPPYIKRQAGDLDKERYQTIYAKFDGSVAAPTAGLHFTPAIFSSLSEKQITQAYVTLHVGAGTFKPVKASSLKGHQMHAEWIDVGAGTIELLLRSIDNGIVAVGTTSMRTLESLYWMGVKTMLNPECKIDDLVIHQWEVYDTPLNSSSISPTEALAALLRWMKINNSERLITQTQILIAPGYRLKIVKALITNFHQPQSTLLVLIAAVIGEDWKRVYEYAMENDFRFLSYGDGSLLFSN